MYGHMHEDSTCMHSYMVCLQCSGFEVDLDLLQIFDMQAKATHIHVDLMTPYDI